MRLFAAQTPKVSFQLGHPVLSNSGALISRRSSLSPTPRVSAEIARSRGLGSAVFLPPTRAPAPDIRCIPRAFHPVSAIISTVMSSTSTSISPAKGTS